MATISTPQYLLDQAKRRLTPSFNNFQIGRAHV